MEELNKKFYRYYNVSSAPFSISYESLNKYGKGIYFIDNPLYYKDQFMDARLVVIKPKLKNPLILRNHKNEIPSREYTDMLLKAIMSEKGIYDRDQFINRLISLGYDSLVVYEKRGMYLILFSNDPDLYQVISDTIPPQNSEYEMAVGGEISPLPFVSASALTSIKEILALPRYKDVSETEASIMYSNWKNDVDSSMWFEMKKKGFTTPFINKLVDKDYLEIDYDTNSDIGGDYTLSEKGKEFIYVVMNRYLTRLGVKKGTDLFPESANVPEVDEKVEKLKKRWEAIGSKFSNEPFADLYGEEVMTLLRKEKGGNLSVEEANFYKNTIANFNVITVENPAQKLIEIQDGKPLNYVSEYNSKYFIQHGVVYRLADHWGQLDTCHWSLDLPVSDKLLVLASCPLSKFIKNE